MLAADAAPTGDQVFQLWTIRDGQPVSEVALALGQAAAVQIVNGISQASEVAVTVERAPGAKTPTLPTKADVKL
jgi:anti-sigma-K factor RskA